jgi:GxxExxY protein
LREHGHGKEESKTQETKRRRNDFMDPELHEQAKEENNTQETAKRRSDFSDHKLYEEGPGERILYKDLSYKIVGAALEVHRELGPGFTENIYEETLCKELGKRGILLQRQVSVDVRYKGEDVGRYQLDLIINDEVVVELKAISQMVDHFEYQLYAYLKATKKKLGLLINFGKKSLEYKRIVN